jgi:hypothetical protein
MKARDANDILRKDGPDGLRGLIDAGHGPRPAIAAWWRNSTSIPPRRFLFGRHYARKAIGATIAAGGRAKTTLALLEAMGMACGRDFLTGESIVSLRVLLLNGEEDQDELDRRAAAVCQHYGLTEEDLGGRLFLQSVRDRPMRLATMVRNAPTLNQEALGKLESEISGNQIDAFMLDPWVSFHSLAENDNGHQDLLLKEGLGGIANRTDTAGEIFHHPGKPKPGQAETTVEDGRGASSILWAVRSARVLNFMMPQQAAEVGIGEDVRRRHIQITNGKANMGPIGTAKWMKLVVENLPNGDEVAVASPWSPPDPFQGVTSADMELARKLAATGDYRTDSRSPEWIGYALASHLRLAVSYGSENERKDLARLKAIIKTWMKNKVLDTEERKDGDGKPRSFVVAGTFKPPPASASYPDPDEALTLQ